MSLLFEELDYRPTPIGALSLRRRRELSLGVDVFEIKLGDEYLMSSLFTASEVALARLGIAALAGDSFDIVVGGLCLGYPPEFRGQLVALARVGRSVEDLAREFEPCAATIHGWIKQAERDGGRRDDGVTSQEREELRRLRRENRQLRQEKDILAKAAAWFAQSDAMSSRSSGS